MKTDLCRSTAQVRDVEKEVVMNGDDKGSGKVLIGCVGGIYKLRIVCHPHREVAIINHFFLREVFLIDTFL